MEQQFDKQKMSQLVKQAMGEKRHLNTAGYQS